MALRLYRPTTPSRRHTSVDDFSALTSRRSLKRLTTTKKRQGGRNNQGKITVRHQGGGAKRFLRKIDFRQDKFDIPAKLVALEYDPNRSVRIAVVQYTDGDKRYALLTEGLGIGAMIMSSQKAIKPEIGNRMPLEFIPVGMGVNSVELAPGRGAEMVRSAGNVAAIMAIEGAYAQLKLPSGEVRLVPKECSATIGQLSGQHQRHLRLGKAGRKRHMGIRPSVRGKAMNPVDHPHGGGEGHNPIGMAHPKTPWGKPALGVKTRKPKKQSNAFIVHHRNTKKS